MTTADDAEQRPRPDADLTLDQVLAIVSACVRDEQYDSALDAIDSFEAGGDADIRLEVWAAESLVNLNRPQEALDRLAPARERWPRNHWLHLWELVAEQALAPAGEPAAWEGLLSHPWMSFPPWQALTAAMTALGADARVVASALLDMAAQGTEPSTATLSQEVGRRLDLVSDPSAVDLHGLHAPLQRFCRTPAARALVSSDPADGAIALATAGVDDRDLVFEPGVDEPTSTRVFYQAAREGRLPRPLVTGERVRRSAEQQVRIVYALHSSLPHVSNGYATRSHGVVRGLRAAGAVVAPMTRPGFPADRWSPGAADRRWDFVGVEDVAGVGYHRLVDRTDGQLGGDLWGYIKAYAGQLAARADALDADVVWGASNAWNGMAVVLAAESLGIPSVYEVRGLWMLTRAAHEPAFVATEHFRELLAVELEACMRATFVLPISRALGDFLHRMGVPREKMHELPNAVDPRQFAPAPALSGLKEKYGLGTSHVIGYIGSLVDYEGLDLLLMAISDLREQGCDVRGLIVGGGGEEQRLRRLASSMDRGGSAVLTGPVDASEVPGLYSLVDTAAFPRLSRSVTELVPPIKPLEAMASGKTVVASDCQALTEIVRDGETGLVFPAGDVGALTDCLRLAATDPDLTSGLRQAAREFVTQERSWEGVCRDAIGFVSRGLE
jgi:glycosyltransferase involved in cell wall biosynthesis